MGCRILFDLWSLTTTLHCLLAIQLLRLLYRFNSIFTRHANIFEMLCLTCPAGKVSKEGRQKLGSQLSEPPCLSQSQPGSYRSSLPISARGDISCTWRSRYVPPKWVGYFNLSKGSKLFTVFFFVFFCGFSRAASSSCFLVSPELKAIKLIVFSIGLWIGWGLRWKLRAIENGWRWTISEWKLERPSCCARSMVFWKKGGKKFSLNITCKSPVICLS